MCQKRWRFATQFEAEAKAADLVAEIGYRMASYRCEACLLWCLTSNKPAAVDVLKPVADGSNRLRKSGDSPSRVRRGTTPS